MKYKGTLKEKFIQLFGKLEFKVEIENSNKRKYEFYEECKNDHVYDEKYYEKCRNNYEEHQKIYSCDLKNLKGEFSIGDKDFICDYISHFHILEKKYTSRIISKQIFGLAIVKDTRFKKHFIIDFENCYSDCLTLDYFNYHNTFYCLDDFDKRMDLKFKRYKRWGIPIGKISLICSALEHFNNEEIEELFRTVGNDWDEIRKILEFKNNEKQLIREVKKFEKQLEDDVKDLPTSKKSIIKF